MRFEFVRQTEAAHLLSMNRLWPQSIEVLARSPLASIAKLNKTMNCVPGIWGWGEKVRLKPTTRRLPVSFGAILFWKHSCEQ